MIRLKPLPYAYNALEPVISEQTLKFHYDKHHKGYVDKLILLLGGDNFELTNVLLDNKDNKAIWNNAAQHHHHEFYWESLRPMAQVDDINDVKNTIPEQLYALITQQFNTLEAFLDKIHSACVGLFGSGWVWISIDTSNTHNTIHIESTANADFPKHKPLLVLDVWEHSYYLDYQNNRSGHIKAILQHLNWDKAFERLQKM